MSLPYNILLKAKTGNFCCVQGTQGTQGTQGEQGIQGLQGSQGTEGTQGTQGIKTYLQGVYKDYLTLRTSKNANIDLSAIEIKQIDISNQDFNDISGLKQHIIEFGNTTYYNIIDFSGGSVGGKELKKGFKALPFGGDLNNNVPDISNDYPWDKLSINSSEARNRTPKQRNSVGLNNFTWLKIKPDWTDISNNQNSRNNNIRAIDPSSIVQNLIYGYVPMFWYNYEPEQWIQLGSDIDGEAADDGSGLSVSISSDGTTVAIGAPFNDENGNLSGHVRVFQFNGEWTQLGSDINGQGANDKFGSSVSLSSDGSRVAIGAANLSSTNSSYVQVYKYEDSAWGQLGGTINGETEYDKSGYSVSLSSDGTTVAIGAPDNDGNGVNSGHVRVYEYDSSDNSWNQLGEDIDGEAGDDESGYSVSLSSDGTIVAIGAPYNDDNGDNSGHVRVYQLDISDTWTQMGSDIDGEAGGDKSGYSVSLSSDGNTVAIGSPQIYSVDAGYVRVYKFNSEGAWTQMGSDINGEATYDYFGSSVSISSDGNTVAIGAYGNDDNGNNSGQVRVYQFNSNRWEQLGNDIDGEAAEDYSGFPVSLSSDGTTVAIGAYKNDGNGTDSGHVRVYKIN